MAEVQVIFQSGHKINGTQAGDLLIELDGDDAVHAQRFKQLFSFFRAGKAVTGVRTAKENGWMGRKSEHNCLTARGMSPLYQLADQCLVAQMNAIERANGTPGAGNMQIVEVGEKIHGLIIGVNFDLK